MRLTKLTATKVLAATAASVCDSANISADGTINWNFIEADLYMIFKPETDSERLLIDVVMNQFADVHENSTTAGKPVRPNFS